MKKLLLSLLVTASATFAYAQKIEITPYPEKLQTTDGQFIINNKTEISAPAELSEIAAYLSDFLGKSSGYTPEITAKTNGNGSINLKLDKGISSAEGYALTVTKSGIDITAATPAGIFYGIQTLRQLMPSDVEIFNESGRPMEWAVPCVEIEDAPRFAWRGLMLDVSRTFMPKELVKRYIDLMAMYKMNTLHWHLVDDQGWRLQIKKYPKLTGIGAKFDSTYNHMGGYYTQADVREIIDFATLRGVEIVPEIEMPGHVLSVLAAYPDLSCTGIRPVIHEFSVGPYVHEEILCAGNPAVYDFVDGVMTEVAALFPSQYIHIGGDEAPKAQWKACPKCQKTMVDNNIKDEEQLQSYFVKRVGNILRDKGKRLIGWDEIYDGGDLGGDEMIMFWRGWEIKNLSKILDDKFAVIMTPTTDCYFDYPYTAIDSKKVYDFNPIPAGTPADKVQYFKGVQANFWSHIDKSENRIDRQLFPRVISLGEIGWTAESNLDWTRFKEAAAENIIRLKSLNVNVFDDKSLEQ